MPVAVQTIDIIKNNIFIPVLVTGSGQQCLIQKLSRSFPNTVEESNMITTNDVNHGKPQPEPY